MARLKLVAGTERAGSIDSSEAADDISAEVAAIEWHVRQALKRALRVEEMLQEVERVLPSEQFHKWLEANQLQEIAVKADFEGLRDWMLRHDLN